MQINEKIYDVQIHAVDATVPSTEYLMPGGSSKVVPFVSPYHKVGDVGVVAFGENEEPTFWPYAEPRLRRWPEQDFAGDPEKGIAPFWSWRLQGSDDRISCKPHFIPGKDGRFIPDETESLAIQIPPEFVQMCAGRALDPELVLRGFIADLCRLQSYVVNPREDGFSSNGSDERMMAEQWFDRAYPDWNDS